MVGFCCHFGKKATIAVARKLLEKKWLVTCAIDVKMTKKKEIYKMLMLMSFM